MIRPKTLAAAALSFLLVTAQSGAQTVRCTTWNLKGKQQVAILSNYQAQAAWAEPWKSMNGVDPPRGFAFAWFKVGDQNIGVYSVHLKSNLITHGDREAETAKNIRKREVAITQLLTHVRDVIGATMPTIKS